MISWYVAQASTYAADVDNLIFRIALIVGVFFLICVVGIVWWVIATAKASKRAEAEKQQ